MKHLIKNVLLIAVSIITWELGKEAAYRMIINATANDDVEVPVDFNIEDHIHLNDIKAEVSD